MGVWGKGILYHMAGITGICLLYLVDAGIRYAKVPVILGARSRIMKYQCREQQCGAEKPTHSSPKSD